MLVSTSNQTYPLKLMRQATMVALAPSCQEEAVAAANWAAVEHIHVRHCKAPGQEYMYRNDDLRRSEWGKTKSGDSVQGSGRMKGGNEVQRES
jgi:hypothetical protein